MFKPFRIYIFYLNLAYFIAYNTPMKKRPYRKPIIPPSNWTTAQDCYLIEHCNLAHEELKQVLPYSDDEIMQRKEILGLIRRSKQLRKWMD